jgi:hypothetical protein
MPNLSNPAPQKKMNRARQLDDAMPALAGSAAVLFAPEPVSVQVPSSYGNQATVSSKPYDRTFVLRHFKPIPATIVNEIRAVENYSVLPVMATVDRHVYSDNGRTIVVPAGTLMLGNVRNGNLPGPYKTIGRIEIEWYRFVRPDGVEFNFQNEKPFSGDSQGRVGVPGYGSTDYLEQMVMPLLTAIVPAVTNLIAPISDKIVNQIDLDNNVVVQTGTMRSSELAKQELIKSWNKVTEKLFVDMLDNTKPPFSIAAGTRITVYSPTDLIVAWCDGSKCGPGDIQPDTGYARAEQATYTIGGGDFADTMEGQVASYLSGNYDKIKDARLKTLMKGFEQYQSKSLAANDVYNQQLESNGGIMMNDGQILQKGSNEYNKEILGMKKKTFDNGTEAWVDPNHDYGPEPGPLEFDDEADDGALMCDGETPPDRDGCCPGETFTDMGEDGWNCCPDAGGDCFPPIGQ